MLNSTNAMAAQQKQVEKERLDAQYWESVYAQNQAGATKRTLQLGQMKMCARARVPGDGLTVQTALLLLTRLPVGRFFFFFPHIRGARAVANLYHLVETRAVDKTKLPAARVTDAPTQLEWVAQCIQDLQYITAAFAEAEMAAAAAAAAETAAGVGAMSLAS